MITNTEFDRRAFLITPIFEDPVLVKMARATLKKAYEKNNKPIIDPTEKIVKCVGYCNGTLMKKSEARKVKYNGGKSRNFCPKCFAKYHMHEIAKGGVHR